jgi:Ion transport protein/Cyclic nucleotide-binding domain
MRDSKINSSRPLLHSNTFILNSMFADVWIRVRIKLKAYVKLLNILNTQRKNNQTYRYSSRVVEFHPELINQTTNNPNNFFEENANFTPAFIFHPESRFKLGWSIFVGSVLMYTGIVMPYTMTFIDSTGFDLWGIIDIVIDAIFFIDFIINCSSAIYDKQGHIIYTRKQILLEYLKGWMLIDLVSCIPFGVITSGNDSYSSGDYNSAIKLIRLPKFYRLFRIARFFKVFKHYGSTEVIEKLQDFLSLRFSAIKLLKTFIMILLCLHIFSCLWYYLAKIENFNPNTWVGYYQLENHSNFFLYITSVYWALATLATVGYGDIHAVNNLEKIYSMIWMTFSVYFLSFVIGSLSSMLNTMDTKENILVAKLAIIDEFSKESNLTKQQTSRLRYALKYSTDKKGFSWIDKMNIFNELPKNLRYEVSLAMYNGAITRIDFFKNKDHVLIGSIAPFLQPIYFNANEFIYRKGEYSEEIYFNMKGRIAYTFGNDNLCVFSVQLGDYFGDIEVALKRLRQCSARALRNSELLIMNKKVINT